MKHAIGRLIRRFIFPMSFLLVLGGGGIAEAAGTLERYPTTSSSQIAFTAHGALWLAPLSGGAAHRMTDDAGDVSTPLFSPDGRSIAFTWRRGGRRDVYVIPAAGGEPLRLTYEATRRNDDVVVVSWALDSRRVIFLSHRDAPVAKLVRAFSVPVDGGMIEALPLDRAGPLSFAPNGHVVAYNRDFRNLELRKRYVGGQAHDLYTYDFNSRVLKRLTDWRGTDTFPMWAGDKIYFLSDRGAGFRANIWRYDVVTQAVSQVTHFDDYDVDWPSLGPAAITFQQGGQLWAIDLPSEHLRRIDVVVADDGARTERRLAAAGTTARVVDALGGVDYALSPHGDALLLSARGDLFTISSGGAGRDLTNTPGVDEDHPSWSPDGQAIAYSTDVDGEQQIAVRAVSGGAPRFLTHFQSGYFYTSQWSPTGDSLTVADANHGLWLLRLNGVAPRLIARDPYAEIRDAAFSADGRWIAYSTQRATGLRAIHLRELASDQDTIVSSPMESDRNPTFTQDGRLVFISQRHEQPFVSDRDDESLISSLNSDGLYVADLEKTARSGDRVQNVGPPRIDVEGLMDRAVALPVTPAVISSLSARGSELYYQTKPPQLIDGDLEGSKSALHALNLGALKDRVVVEGLSNSDVSADGTAVVYRRDGAWWIIQARPSSTGGAREGTKVDLAGLRVEINPRLEWAEMFKNAWRLDRDVFFSKAMNGDDWPAVYKAYVKLVPELGSEDDFLWLLGQMQGEIASSHTFLGSGPTDGSPAAPTARLGVDYARDQASGRYRFAHIYRGDPTRAELRAPLRAPGLGIAEGDYLMAINGRELTAPETPDQMLAGAKGSVAITVSTSPAGPRREVKVDPVTDEISLRQLDMVKRNRAWVDRASGGRVGYVFLRDFDAAGSRDFLQQFYPQRDKQGLVIDVRWNSGGFTSQAVLDVLRRRLAGVFVNREGALSPLPGVTAPSVMVTLMNYGSASDGDQFPFFFREFGLGQLVGEQTWGGVQGINQPWRLLDGDFILIPKDALASPDGRWVIENAGVTPDIPTSAAPNDAFYGRDTQLEVATKAVLDMLIQRPPKALRAPPALPPYPPPGEVPPAGFGKSDKS
jgi:tricorn protease